MIKIKLLGIMVEIKLTQWIDIDVKLFYLPYRLYLVQADYQTSINYKSMESHDKICVATKWDELAFYTRNVADKGYNLANSPCSM